MNRYVSRIPEEQITLFVPQRKKVMVSALKMLVYLTKTGNLYALFYMEYIRTTNRLPNFIQNDVVLFV